MQQLQPFTRQETLVSGEIKKLFLDFVTDKQIEEENSEQCTSHIESMEELLSEFAPPRQIVTTAGDLWSETSLLALDRPAPDSH